MGLSSMKNTGKKEISSGKKRLLFLTNDINLQLGGQGLSNIILFDYFKEDFVLTLVNQQFFKGTSNYRMVNADFTANFRKSFFKGLLELFRIIRNLNEYNFNLIVISSPPFSTLLYLTTIRIFGLFRNSRKVHFCRIDPMSGIFSASRIPYLLFPIGFFLYNTLDKVVIQNPQMGQSFKKYYRVNKSKIILIPNPLRPDYTVLIKDNTKLDFAANKPWITTITRLETKQKDPETLFKAFKLVKDKIKTASLIICGTGSEKDKLEKLADKLGIDKDVHFLGFVKNPFTVLKKSDVFVLSSRAEGFGKVIVEAQITKVPVVATDCPVGPRWALDNGKAGILVPVGNEAMMAKAILNLLNDSEKRQKFVQKGRELAARHYPEKFYKSLDDLLSPFQ